MGWTYHRESKSEAEALAELRRLHAWASESGRKYRILADGLTGSGERMGYYAAIEAVGGDDPREVFCSVCLVSLRPFGYKDMGEGMGPYIDNAPLEVLRALEPLPPESGETCRTCSGDGVLSGPHWEPSAIGAECHACHGSGKFDRYRYAREWRKRAWARHGGEAAANQLELI